MDELQDLVDALAATLGRPVNVDDHRFRLLAFSSHVEDVDPCRVRSILRRETPPEVAAWLETFALRTARGLVRIPDHPALGMRARIAIPLRSADMLLGFLWLIDAPRPLADDELAEAERCAERAALLLWRMRLVARTDRRRERELTERLLTCEDAERGAAVHALGEAGLLEPAPAYVVLALWAAHDRGAAVDDAVRVRLAAALDKARRAVAPRRQIAYVAGPGATVLLACAHEQDALERASALQAAAQATLAELGGWRAIVGVSAARASLAEAHAAQVEACEAVELAYSVEELGPVAAWTTLGAYRTIGRMLRGAAPGDAIPAPIRRLAATPDAATLLRTLEVFLELAGDASGAARALHLHRSSLYGRLRRIEAIAEVNLRSGDDRLALHLGLRLRRIADGIPTPEQARHAGAAPAA